MSDTENDTNEALALGCRSLAERRLMDWVRTALSMVAFGFAIYKGFQILQEQSTAHVLRSNAPRNVALALMGIGAFAIIAASIQHWKYVRKLSATQSQKPWDLAFIVAGLTALLGLLLFVSVLFRPGPIG